MYNPKISIIIPIYNTESYLIKCLDSVINQTYCNLEIILVDDGSTDGSKQIIEDYEKKDSRIVAVYKKNAGVANARNTGLQISTGEYIGFVDSDDWIEPDMYQELVRVVKSERIDIVSGNYYFDKGEEQVVAKNLKPISREVFDKNQLLEYVFMRDSYKGLAAYPWNKIFRRDILRNNDQYITYEDKYKIGEDVLWFAHVSLKCETSKYVDKPLYHYVQRNDSAVHSTNLEKQMHRIAVYQDVIHLFQNNAISDNIIIYVKRFWLIMQ